MIARALPFLLLALLPAEDPIATSFEVLAGFDYSEGMKLPEEVLDLDEETVLVQGFMAREIDGDGPVDQFLLINDACGCNGTPKMNEIVICTLAEGDTTDILPGVVKVTGKLWVGEEKEDGEVIGIYFLDADKIE